VERFLGRVTPATPVEQARYGLAVDLLEDIRRLDALKASHKRIRAAVRASGPSVTDLFGVGPIIAAGLIGYTGDVGRFGNRDRFAAYNGTAPVEFSSGGRVVHRVSERGNRQLNRAIHMAAICQLRQPHSEGKTNMEAIRALKRQISNAVYRRL
jgi:transposase